MEQFCPSLPFKGLQIFFIVTSREAVLHSIYLVNIRDAETSYNIYSSPITKNYQAQSGAEVEKNPGLEYKVKTFTDPLI